MDNAGDWLYIVFLIVAGIGSLFGSKKKKRQTEVLGRPGKQTVEEEEKQPQKGFWEILQEMENGATENSRPAASQPTAPNMKKQKQQKKTEPTPFLTVEKQLNKSAAANDFTPTPILEEESGITGLELDNAADLRKAVIYAEILNRKY